MRCPRFLLAAVLLTAVALAVAGCGTATTAATATGSYATTSTTSTGSVNDSTTGGPGPVPSSGPLATATPTTRPSATTRPSPTTTLRPVSGPPVEINLTEADDQRTVTLRVGDTVRLLLDDPNLQWTNVSTTPDGLLAPDPSPSPPPHGALSIWTAAQAGAVTIKAVGTAWCPAPAACPMFARLFQITAVIV